MAPKSPNAPPEHTQGSLFTEEVVGNGSTDAAIYQAKHVFTPVEGGVFLESEPAKAEYNFSDPEILEAVKKANQTDRRSKAQRGKHSPLQRDGTYLSVKPGDVLPRGLINDEPYTVTHGNLTEAQKIAQKLEDEKLNKH